MNAQPLVITIQNPHGALFYIVAVLVAAAVISLMLWRDAKRARKTTRGRLCKVCGGRTAITASGALIHAGDAHLVARALPHTAETLTGVY